MQSNMPVGKRYDNIEEDFIYAQNKVLKEKQNFDKQREIFICDFENTFDVQAVPGSGKTTALLAKLVMLEKNINNLDGGVLVLSHTNKSVDNIRRRLGDLCPQLCNSNYHFIGTIQSFVNDFLAKPYFSMKTGNKIQDIDDDIYDKSVVWKLKGNTGVFLKIHKPSQFSIIDYPYSSIIKTLDGKVINIKKSRSGGITKKGKPILDYTNDEKENIFNTIKNKQITIYRDFGILRFFDAFRLGHRYIEKISIIKTILQKRFKYVYIDEMQDLEKYQIDLIDCIFGDYNDDGEYVTPCVIQRIGDISQCVFHEGSENGKSTRNQRFYLDSNKPYYISGSHRLHQATANVVNLFKYGNTDDVIGSSKELLTKPTILLFENGKEKEVNKRFIDSLQNKGYEKNYDNGLIVNKDNADKRYTAIGRTGKNKVDEKTVSGDNKRCLKHYFPDYLKDASPISRKSNEYFSTMLGYINNYDSNDKGLTHIRKMVLHSMVRPIKGHEKYKKFGISDFLKKLQNDMGEDGYQGFLIKIYTLCKKIKDSNKDETILIGIKDELVDYFNSNINASFLEITLSDEYIGNILRDSDQKEIKIRNENFIEYRGYYLNIDSVHGAKGQDHEATLYLMTNFHRDDFGYFRDIIKGDKKCSNLYHQQAQKIFYVGFSRAKKWLCYAVLKDYVTDEDEALLISKGREINKDLV